MADTKVSDLPTISSISDNDILYIGDISQSTSNKITYKELFKNTNDNFITLSDEIDQYTTVVLDLSSQFSNFNINISPLITDILTVSGGLDTLSADFYEFLYVDMASVSGIIDASLSALSAAVDDNTNAIANGITQDVTIDGTTLKFQNGILIGVM